MNLVQRVVVTLVIGIAVVAASLQIAAEFFLKPMLEREGRRLFRVPVVIERAGANVLGGSIWMKGVHIKNAVGFSEPTFLTAKTIAIDLSVLSLLTSEFVIDRIVLKDPVVTVEFNGNGEKNLDLFSRSAARRLQRWAEKRGKLIQLATRYELEKFSVRRGTLRLVDQRKPGMEKRWSSISFALARVVYPADPQEALPVAVYLSAATQGGQEGQAILIGRFNPFAEKKSFDVTLSLKDISLTDYNYFLPRFPLNFTQGTLQMKVKALCHDDQVDLHHQIKVKTPKLEAKAGFSGKAVEVFNLPPETVANFFNEFWPESEPFALDFDVVGNLKDPGFDIRSEIKKYITQTVHARVTQKMNELVASTKQIADEALRSDEGDRPVLTGSNAAGLR